MSFHVDVQLTQNAPVHAFATKLFDAFSIDKGSMSDDNVRYVAMNVSFVEAGEGNRTCDGWQSIQNGENETQYGIECVCVQNMSSDAWEIISNISGREMIKIPKMMNKTYKSDSESIRLAYQYDDDSNNTKLVTSLSVCDFVRTAAPLTSSPLPLTSSSIYLTSSPLSLRGTAWFKFFTFGIIVLSVISLAIVVIFSYTFVSVIVYKIFIFICANLALSLTSWLFSRLMEISTAVCAGAAILGHYFWLVTFCWMTALGLHLKLMTSATKSDKQLFKKVTANTHFYRLCVSAFGFPVLVTFTSVFVTYFVPSLGFSYGIRMEFCWITNKMQNIALFLTPMALLVLTSVVFFTMTLFTVHGKKELPLRQNVLAFLPYVITMPLFLGVAWLAHFLATMQNQGKEIFWIFFEMNAGSSGILLFVIFVANR